MTAPRVLTDGLVIGESPRWREGRLWYAAWGDQEIHALDPAGNREVVGRGTCEFGYSFDWLPDGRLLVTGTGLMRQEADGSLVTHADLSRFPGGWNEIVVDGRGNIYVNGQDFDFIGGGEFRGGIIVLVTPDGTVRRVAEDIAFPNGMVVTPDNSTLIISESFAGRLTAFDIDADGGLSHRRVWADGVGPDGICMDAEGAIWTGPDTRDGTTPPGCIRIREGGEVLDRIEVDRGVFACMLGGADRRTLFLLAAEWRMEDSPADNIQRMSADRTGQVLMAPAPVPGAGWP